VPSDRTVKPWHGWLEPPSYPPTASSGIQVWRIDVTTAPPWARDVLVRDELDRIARRRRQADRQALTASYAALRLLLGAALNCAPCQIRFAIGSHGKPYVPGAWLPGAPLHFNLSHSGDLCLIALCREYPVGVDVEPRDRATDAMDLARRFFHRSEIAALEAIPEADRVFAFMRLWVCKEAYVKARGGGLSMGLERFAIPLADPPEQPVQVLTDESASSPGWFVRALDPGPGYVAAVASPDPHAPIELYSFRFETFR
jgi:4'-phosphopantetheinyl transferase